MPSGRLGTLFAFTGKGSLRDSNFDMTPYVGKVENHSATVLEIQQSYNDY